MSTECNPQQYQLNSNQTDYTTDPPWADLELTVPNDRSPISIVSFVECVLVELTHEPVAADKRFDGPCKHRTAIAIRPPIQDVATQMQLVADGGVTTEKTPTEPEDTN